jgi:hypothetical protein
VNSLNLSLGISLIGLNMKLKRSFVTCFTAFVLYDFKYRTPQTRTSTCVVIGVTCGTGFFPNSLHVCVRMYVCAHMKNFINIGHYGHYGQHQCLCGFTVSYIF